MNLSKEFNDDIAIVGAGGLGRETLLVIQQINQCNNSWRFIGFFDDGLRVGSEVCNYKILGSVGTLNTWIKELGVVIAIADPQIKYTIVKSINNPHIVFSSLIHPSAIYGELHGPCKGLIVGANSSLTTNINIGSHVIINLNCTIGHDTSIEDFCSIMPGTNISGNVTIKKRTYIGTGVQVLPGVTIGANVTVGAGAVVTKDIPSNQVVAGIPARRIK